MPELRDTKHALNEWMESPDNGGKGRLQLVYRKQDYGWKTFGTDNHSASLWRRSVAQSRHFFKIPLPKLQRRPA
ncbi:MAG: hypothetical protein AAF557_17745 [Pseudomonadota bacterium]